MRVPSVSSSYLFLRFFSRPAEQRAVYRAIRRIRPRRIVEIGVGTALRARRMIELAARYARGEKVEYTGIDPFELRDSAVAPGLSLKMAYRQLAATRAQIRLVPGDVRGALARTANALVRTDLLVISAEFWDTSAAFGWFYVPRMLQQSSLVLAEQPAETGKGELRIVSHAEIEKLAQRDTPHVIHAAAAFADRPARKAA